MTSLILPEDEVIRQQGRRHALRSHEAGDWCCLSDDLPLDWKKRERQSKTRRFAAGLNWAPYTVAVAAAGWNQFYLYRSPSSVSRNLPHTTEQLGGKADVFSNNEMELSKKISLNRCLAGLPQQFRPVVIYSLIFKHSCCLVCAWQKKLNELSEVVLL